MSDLTDRLRCFDRQTCTEAAGRIETLEAELAAMRAGVEPVAAPMVGEMALIAKALQRVGITNVLNHGAASCVFSQGCAGVSQGHLLAYTREIALQCAAALYAHPQPAAQDAERKLLTDEQAPAQAAPAYKDSTPELHIGDSAFESWYSTYSPAHKSDKQRVRDAYAAGMGDPLVVAAPTPQTAAQDAERYRLLNLGVDVIQADDEFLSDDTTTWATDPNGVFVGMPYQGYALLPARRKLVAAIAAQQGDSHE